jgi:hypothetical protein
MTSPISEMPLVQYEENDEEDLVLSNAFKKVFPENSETQENSLNLNQLYYTYSNQIKKGIFTNSIKFSKIYKWTDIKKCINKNNGFSEDIIHIINDDNLSNQYYDSLNVFYINKKRKRGKKTGKINKTLKKKSNGRIKNEDKNNGKNGKHNKYEPDNIIKKCKRIFISCMIEHFNMYIDEEKYGQLLDLDYSFISNLKKDSDLELLNMKLKDIASKDISSKYKTKLEEKNWNKIVIDKILNNENNENNNEKLINLLNITFNEWIDIFTYKIENEYNKNTNLLQSALVKIDQKNCGDKEYLTKLIFYLYNYKRWFESKKGRNVIKKKIEQKEEI